MTSQYRKSNQYALAALKERRAMVSGEIVTLQRRIRHLNDLLNNIDGTLTLFMDDDPKKIPAKRSFKRTKLFKAGELNRLILTALRRAGRPLTTGEVIEGVAKQLGHGPEAARGLASTVRSNLCYLAKERGWITKEGERYGATWSLKI